MPTQLAFDGQTLEAALARVNDEVGPRARITQAEKIRTGGIAGFFARERFEVTVEIDEEAAPETDADPGPVATDQIVTEQVVTEPVAPKSLLDLVEEVSAQERVAGSSAAPPRPSTDGKTFHAVLQGIAAEAGLISPPAPADEPAPSLRPEAPGLDDAGPTTRSAWLDQLPRIEDAPRPEDGPTTGVTSPIDEPIPVTSETLVALGIPAALLGPGSGRATPAQRVLTAMEQLPDPAPLVARRGEVVVVVGDEAVASEAATAAAAQFGLTADDVVTAGIDRRGFNTLATAEEAAARAGLWRRCGAPFVVAVCVPATGEATRWAKQVIEALEPVAVWAAVRADRKPEDVAAWTQALGRVDALAVGACAETVSPAAVLGAGVPVAVLEGRRSTPAAWTALLVERLTA